MNKKGVSGVLELGGGILGLLVFLFSAFVIWNIFQYQVITPLIDIVSGSGFSNIMSVDSITNIQSIKTYVLSFSFPFDLIGLLVIIGLFYKVFSNTLNKPKLSKGQFFSSIFILSLFEVIYIYFISDIVLWFKNEFFITFLGADLKIVYWFVDNLGFILFLTSITLLVVNQLQRYISVEGLRE